jgi:hypothetical protein
MEVLRDCPVPAYGGRRRLVPRTAEAIFRAKLGHDLRAMYAEVLREPLPQPLAAVADRIERERLGANHNG